MVEEVVGVGTGYPGLLAHYHAGLLWCAARFAMVAGDACRDHILPGVGPASESRQDVVQCQLPALSSAVLAQIAISRKDLSAGEAALEKGPAYE